jgi:hypothetical protein|tara:strand:- start:720 stop:968 length:249 start_codon:yes stop_codon:yes gene_type:complete
MSSTLPRGLCVETQEITFNKETLKTVILTGGHIRDPKVTVTSFSGENANFNFFISLVAVNSVTVEASGEYTGTVFVQAISTL